MLTMNDYCLDGNRRVTPRPIRGQIRRHCVLPNGDIVFAAELARVEGTICNQANLVRARHGTSIPAHRARVSSIDECYRVWLTPEQLRRPAPR